MQITKTVNDLEDWPDITDEQNENYIDTAENATRHMVEIHDPKKRKSLLIGGALLIMGLLLLFLTSVTSFLEIDVLPNILLIIGIILLVAALVFFINAFISIFLPKR
jgi:uncharacterized membrane protein HdeD (DUF308 family)